MLRLDLDPSNALWKFAEENTWHATGETVSTLPGRLNKLKSDPWAEMPTLRQSISAKVRREIGI